MTADSLPPGLCCPVDGTPVAADSPTWLKCEQGHAFPVVDGIPVMLRADVPPTMWLLRRSLERATEYSENPAAVVDPMFLDTVGISPAEVELARKLASSARDADAMDPVVSVVIAATSGHLYKHLIGKLGSYPIPEIRLPPSDGANFLDVGCNWGRWCIAAARKGYRAVGIDPSLGAVLAAKRLAARLGLDVKYVCGDARYLPFAASRFDQAYSYSVLQHFSKTDAEAAIAQMARVLSPQGRCLVQLAHTVGLRSGYHQALRGFRDPEGFDVRYWPAAEMRRVFARYFARADVSVHCYFGLGLEPSDAPLMRPAGRAAIRVSEALRRASQVVTPLKYLADSLFVDAEHPLSH